MLIYNIKLLLRRALQNVLSSGRSQQSGGGGGGGGGYPARKKRQGRVIGAVTGKDRDGF